MAHKHTVRDDDNYFIVDPNTRELYNTSGEKVQVMQYDHNSEVITFEIPKVIEGHNMLDCDVVEVHFTNVGTGTSASARKINPDIWTVEDLAPNPDDEETLRCTWPVSQNAALYSGTTHFLLKFMCTEEDGTPTYIWHTNICVGIEVSAGLNNADLILNILPDAIQRVKNELTGLIADNAEDILANKGTLDEHSNKLDDHNQQLGNHTNILGEHDQKFDNHWMNIKDNADMIESHRLVLANLESRMDECDGKYVSKLPVHTGATQIVYGQKGAGNGEARFKLKIGFGDTEDPAIPMRSGTSDKSHPGTFEISHPVMTEGVQGYSAKHPLTVGAAYNTFPTKNELADRLANFAIDDIAVATTLANGLMSAADKAKLDGIVDATPSIKGLMSAADKAKLDAIEANANNYTHPTHTAKTSGMYKITVDSLGHVTGATAITKSDITGLGIPAQDTTYVAATSSAAGLMSAAQYSKLLDLHRLYRHAITLTQSSSSSPADPRFEFTIDLVNYIDVTYGRGNLSNSTVKKTTYNAWGYIYVSDSVHAVSCVTINSNKTITVQYINSKATSNTDAVKEYTIPDYTANTITYSDTVTEL